VIIHGYVSIYPKMLCAMGEDIRWANDYLMGQLPDEHSRPSITSLDVP
jgi:hypothetical protein